MNDPPAEAARPWRLQVKMSTDPCICRHFG